MLLAALGVSLTAAFFFSRIHRFASAVVIFHSWTYKAPPISIQTKLLVPFRRSYIGHGWREEKKLGSLPLFTPHRSWSFLSSFHRQERKKKKSSIRKCMHGEAWREKSPISFMILFGGAFSGCVSRGGGREKKTKKQKPELLNINQDDNKMEKMYEKYFSNNA